MPIYREAQLQQISRQFQIYGEILHAETCKIGHINETYSATYDQGGTRVRYIHQKINQSVFKDPASVMRNVMRVTSHLRRKLEELEARDLTRRCLTIVPTRDGQAYYTDSDGDFWRTFVFIEGVQTFESVQSPNQAFEAGKAFGFFQHLLVDLPGGRLAEAQDGKFAESFNRLDRQGAIVQCNLADQHQKLAEHYLALAKDRHSTVVVSQSWNEIHQVNEQIRLALKGEKLVGEADKVLTTFQPVDMTDAQKRDQRSYDENSVVVFNRNVRGFKAGEAARFQAITETHVVVESVQGLVDSIQIE